MNLNELCEECSGDGCDDCEDSGQAWLPSGVGAWLDEILSEWTALARKSIARRKSGAHCKGSGEHVAAEDPSRCKVTFSTMDLDWDAMTMTVTQHGDFHPDRPGCLDPATEPRP